MSHDAIADHAAAPFQQAAQNASGVNVAPPTPQSAFGPAASSINGMFGLGDAASGGMLGGYLPFVIGALGLGALGVVAAAGGRRPVLVGALVQGGAMAGAVGLFGAALPNTHRMLYGATGAAMLGGAFYARRA